MRRITILTLSFLTVSICFGQIATIKIDGKFYDNSYMNFDSIFFEFNGTKFCAGDTTLKTIRLQKNFDSCTAIIGKDTLVFLTKFKSEQEYIIRPGCCCAAFTLEPRNNPRRGTITYKNKTKRNLCLSVCGHNSDTVEHSKQKTIYGSESAMCLFKPCQIVIAEIDFLTAHFDSDSYLKSILNTQWFHFLHGERIEIIYSDKKRKMKLKLIGYLTDEEYEKGWE